MRIFIALLVLVAVATARKWRPRKSELRCKYDKGEWSDCNVDTNTVTRELTLVSGEEGCQEIQSQTMSCEKYEQIQSSEERSNERKGGRREEGLSKRGEKHRRKETRKIWKYNRKNCKYEKGEWSECDNTTNTVTRELTLRDSVEGCEPTLTVNISCDMLDDIQRKEERNQLKEDRKMVKMQRKLGCNFDVSFSDCDPNTQMVTKTYTPISQEEDSSCEGRTVTYSCQLHEQLMAKKEGRQQKGKGIKHKFRKGKRGDKKGRRH